MMSLLSIQFNFFKTIKILNIFQYILTHLTISNQIQYNEEDFFQIWHLFDCCDFVGQEKLYRCTSIDSYINTNGMENTYIVVRLCMKCST